MGGPGVQGGSGGLRIPPAVSVSGPSSHQVQTRSVSVQGELRNSEIRNSEIRNSELRISNSGVAAPQVPTSSSIATYANVQFRVKGSGESLHKTAVNSTRHTGVPGSEFDVDLDAIAATMQGHSTGTHEMSKTASPQMSRPLKSRAMGMISGVATNLKSRLSQFNSSGSSLSPGNQSSQHHQSDGSKVVSALHSPARSSTSSGSESAGPLAAASSSLSNHVIKRHSLGEQPASVIPLTVPGADSTMPSFPYGYPERLDMKPVGPRDPPSHFQRKQEYL